MAKVSFTKFGLKVDQPIKTIEYNGQVIEIKQYLPFNDKMAAIEAALAAATDEQKFLNPVRVEFFTRMEILYRYTNINFTDKQKEDEAKLYDLFQTSGLWTRIWEQIPQCETAFILDSAIKSAAAISEYQVSMMGILDTMGQNYDATKFDVETLQKSLNDPNSIPLLKEIMTKLG